MFKHFLPLIVMLLSACMVTKKVAFNRLSNDQVCQQERAYYPIAKGIFRMQKHVSKKQKAAEYVDIVDFVNVYDKNGFLIASTGNGSCEFNTLSTVFNNLPKPDSTRTIQSLLHIIEPVCLQQQPGTDAKNTIVVGSAQFLDAIPTYKSRRKLLNERLNAFPRESTTVFIVNFDLRPDTAVEGK